ncbi:uncharacterized protein DUF481 [Algoriphagus boseongensis]|uniref:Uncharacterized protein DUF481 n=1 Tax=Algoriphagus boseongensis TaxID=1442587 RepID=A0A4R6T0M2_9BACT|nr:DUF481 domain-containing protein [Algoriphagus boseongensis]TDQ13800.1 uncharacterized protein DUF481 [Algoriphagus boseongensis]
MRYLFSLIFLFSMGFSGLQAQTDSVLFKNENLLIGEIKSMDRGILVIETPYSNVDFKIDWKEIKRISSSVNYLITLSDGRRFNGSFRSVSDSSVLINSYIPDNILKIGSKAKNIEEVGASGVEVPIGSIVYLNALDEGFWSRLSLFFDAGVNFTKANDLRQFTFNSGVGYLADRWKTNLNFNNLRSTQSKTDPIKRTELAYSFNYFLPKDWFVLYNLNMLSNTEQLLDLRASNMVGIGKYLIHTNQTYLGFQGGVNLNNEKFSTDPSSSQTAESFLAAQYNIYDIGDLDLLSTVTAYPSLSTKGRVRSDIKFDIRYEFKFDLYFKISTSINYDNKPTEGASKTDYIFQTTIGWKL